MQNIKNFKRFEPSLVMLQKYQNPEGDIPVFLQSDGGLDWYESQALFADDTVKLMYDSDAIIRSVVDTPVPQRGNTYAVSMFFPEGMSVAEVAIENYPEGCCIDGTWKFDGANIYQDAGIVDANIKISNTKRRNSLAVKAASAIAMINASANIGNPREGDADNFILVQQYLDELRDVELNTALPSWPPEPACIT